MARSPTSNRSRPSFIYKGPQSSPVITKGDRMNAHQTQKAFSLPYVKGILVVLLAGCSIASAQKKDAPKAAAAPKAPAAKPAAAAPHAAAPAAHAAGATPSRPGGAAPAGHTTAAPGARPGGAPVAGAHPGGAPA